MPWIRSAVWALGELGYADIILRFLELNRYVEDKCLDCSKKTEYYYLQQWIIDRYCPEGNLVELQMILADIILFNSPSMHDTPGSRWARKCIVGGIARAVRLSIYFD